MARIAIIVPYARRAWRKTQEMAFFSATFEPLALDLPKDIQISLNVLSCDLHRPLKLHGDNVRIHRYGFNSEVKAIKLFLATKQGREADAYLYCWLGVRPLPDAFETLIQHLADQPIVYGRTLGYTETESYGQPLTPEHLYEPEDGSSGFSKRFQSRCPIPPLFLCRKSFLEGLDENLPGAYILDAAARHLGTDAYIDKVTATSKFRLIDFGHPLSGDEGVILSSRWGALSPRSEFV